MTAGENQPQPIVLHAALVEGRFVIGGQGGHLLELDGPRRGAAQAIEGTIARRRRQPGAGVAGDAIAGPTFQRPREGVLRALLGEIPVTGDPDQGRDDPSPLLTERPGDGGVNVGGYRSQIGLTSIDPTRAPGIFAAISMASSRSLQSTL